MSVNAVTIGNRKAIVTPGSDVFVGLNGKMTAHKSSASPFSYVPVSKNTVFGNVAKELQPLASQIYAMAQANSAKSAEYAQDLRNWQQNIMQLQGDFNSAEAAKNRAWQQMMSNTAHQREIADLKAAGLNPVLSAMNGNGASVGSGATASLSAPSGAMGNVDTSANGAIVSLLASMLSAQTQLAGQALSAQTNQAIADKNNATSKMIAEMNNQVSERINERNIELGVKQIEASLSNAHLGYLASLYGADSSKFASIVGSQLGYDASVIGSQLGYDASVYGTDTNARLTEEYPSNPWRMISSAGQTVAKAVGYESPAEFVITGINSMLDAGTKQLYGFLHNHTNLSDSQIDKITGNIYSTARATAHSKNGFTAGAKPKSSINSAIFYDRIAKNLWNKVDRLSR